MSMQYNKILQKRPGDQVELYWYLTIFISVIKVRFMLFLLNNQPSFLIFIFKGSNSHISLGFREKEKSDF